MSEKINKFIETLLEDYKQGRDVDKVNVYEQPEREEVEDIVQKSLALIYPGFFRENRYKNYNVSSVVPVLVETLAGSLQKQVAIALQYEKNSELTAEEIAQRSDEIVTAFFERLPEIRRIINTDIQASFEGDPAACNKEEIILCYPGLLAITIHRIAYELHVLRVPMIPRMMAEYAHSKTGIDIHPAAKIGEYFFTDHGTGIVVGSTTVIGDHVKIYQGVTLGALSTSKGQALHGVKRHPTVEDNVTIYSGASILGGDTVIGEGSVIGGNVFLTKSVEPGTRVTVQNQELRFDCRRKATKDCCPAVCDIANDIADKGAAKILAELAGKTKK